MESPRTSLWSRLVFYYSNHKPDQLKPEVMADIVGKYASKEGELSARLRKKYGHPLPSEVSVQDLRLVLANFGLEDKDFRESCEQETLSSSKTPALQTGYEQLEAPRPAGSEATERPHVGTGHQESPTGGSALDFRSKYFDPLQALRHKTLRPPYPDEPVLDNLAKFRRLLPKIPPSTTVASSTAIGGSGVDVFTRQTQGGPVNTLNSAIDNYRGGGYGPGVSSAGTAHAVEGSSVAQYRKPALRSAAELDKVDRELASRRRASDLASHTSSTGADNLEEEGVNPLTTIMKKYVGTGPYSLLYRLHDEKRRANVMIRRVNSIRGTCSGLIRAFDRHMNMLLVDVREDYTALVPVRDRAPNRARPVSADEDGQHSDGAGELAGVGSDGCESEASASRSIDSRGVPKGSGEVERGERDRRSRMDLEMESMHVREQGPQQVATVTEARKVETGGREPLTNARVSAAGVGDLAHAAESTVSTQQRTRVIEDRGGVDQGNRTAVKDERSGTGRKRSSRRYRRKGVRTGEIMLVKRRRFLKQLLIRGDNVVMVWEEPKYMS